MRWGIGLDDDDHEKKWGENTEQSIFAYPFAVFLLFLSLLLYHFVKIHGFFLHLPSSPLLFVLFFFSSFYLSRCRIPSSFSFAHISFTLHGKGEW
jgi:hypothetical protein